MPGPRADVGPRVLVQGRIATLVGLAIWVERLKAAGKLPLEKIRAEEAVLFGSMPTNATTLLNYVLPLFSARASQDLRWSRWEMDLRDEMVVGGSDRDWYLALVLVVALLRCDLGQVQVDDLRFPHGLLYFLEGDSSPMARAAVHIESELAEWTHVLSPSPTMASMRPQELFANIVGAYLRRFRENLVGAPLSEPRLKAIAAEASASLVGGSVLRGALLSQKSWIQLSQLYERGTPYLGINTVTDKEPFADLVDGMGHSGLGASYGHGVALAYDRWLSSELRARSVPREVPIAGAFDRVLAVLKTEDLDRGPFSVLILGATRGLSSQMWGHPSFLGRYGDVESQFDTMPGYQGRFRVGDHHSLLVVQTIVDSLRDSSILLAGGSSVMVEEACPLPLLSMTGAVPAPPLLLWVRAFSEDEAMTAEFLSAPPKWLQDPKYDPPGDYLRTKVLLQLLSHLRIVENGVGRAIVFDWQRSE